MAGGGGGGGVSNCWRREVWEAVSDVDRVGYWRWNVYSNFLKKFPGVKCVKGEREKLKFLLH